MSKVVFGIFGVMLLSWTAAFGWLSWANSHRIVPGSINESLLYRTYDPVPVFIQFRDEQKGHGEGGGSAAGRGIKSIHHSRDFDQMFAMQANRKQELLNALRQDILNRLHMPGTTVVVTDAQPNKGFTCEYISGNSHGSISVEVPAPAEIVRHYPLPNGLEDVQVRIDLEETWTRPPNETQWWMSDAD